MNTMDRFSLKGKIAIITGGERLYGKSCSIALCDAGAKLYMACPFVEQAEATANEIRANGGDVTVVEYNQGNEESINNLVKLVMEKEGRIDVLVNCARVIGKGNGWELTMADMEFENKVNSVGFLMLTRLVGDIMKEQRSGSIINFASMMGIIGVEPYNYKDSLEPRVDCFGHTYFFTKSGLINFTRQAASYYGPYGVRVNSIGPGGLESERTTPEFVKRYSKHTMLGRMANDEDVKGVVVFLASDASSYLTGCNIQMDGGYTSL